jgi:hypothetical protein
MSGGYKGNEFWAELSQVNAAISALSAQSNGRDKAVEILGRFGALCTPQLKREDYQAVLAAVSKELERFAS